MCFVSGYFYTISTSGYPKSVQKQEKEYIWTVTRGIIRRRIHLDSYKRHYKKENTFGQLQEAL